MNNISTVSSPSVFYQPFLDLKPVLSNFYIPEDAPAFMEDTWLSSRKYNPGSRNYLLNKDFCGRLCEAGVSAKISHIADWINRLRDPGLPFDFQFVKQLPKFNMDTKGVIGGHHGLCVDNFRYDNQIDLADLYVLFFMEYVKLNGISHIHFLLQGYLTKQDVLDRKEDAFPLLEAKAHKYNLDILNH